MAESDECWLDYPVLLHPLSSNVLIRILSKSANATYKDLKTGHTELPCAWPWCCGDRLVMGSWSSFLLRESLCLCALSLHTMSPKAGHHKNPQFLIRAQKWEISALLIHSTSQ